jgi:hypothetical protein
MLNRWMKHCYALLIAAVALPVGSAHALPFLWTDDFDPGDVLVTANSPFSFTHSILGGNNGFRPGIDSVTNAVLSVVLADDALLGDLPLFGDGQETVSFSFDGSGWTMPQDVGLLDIFDFQFSSLLTDGILGVSLRATQGDFKFLQSSLIVFGNRAAVAEPASMALFGFGLVGLAIFATRGRRRAAMSLATG